MTFELIAEGASRDLHPIVRDDVYRIAYEALRNACLHSGGSKLEVRLSYVRDLVLRIRDNGIGIGSGILAKGKDGHFGIAGMQERAAHAGAKLSFHSLKPGTEIELVVPGHLGFREKSGHQ